MKNYILGIFIFLLLPFATYAQKQTVSGVVSDETGETLPGVNILIKGTDQGTMSDIYGKFKLSDVSANATLVISYIGFETQEVAVGGRTSINISLVSEISQLDEIVVVGYGTSRKKDLTGSVASVTTEELVTAPTANYDQALMGRVAGVQVNATEGTPGAPMEIVIRGGNSITGSNSPLYVVDGIPLQDFDPATINTEDIKEFTILKDASATAIYGSRGANGVIVITTKGGGDNNGKTTVTAGYSTGYQQVARYMEVMSPYEYVRYREMQAFARSNWSLNGNAMIPNFYETWGDPEQYRNIEGHDWQDSLFRTAKIDRYNVSVNGGNKKTNIYFSGNVTNQDGTLITTSFQKMIGNLRVKHNLADWASFNAGLMYSHSKRTGPTLRENSWSSITRDAIRFRPVDPIRDDGLPVGGFDPTDPNQNVMYPPAPNLRGTIDEDKQDVVRGNVSLNLKPTKDLTFNMRANYQGEFRNEALFYGEDTRQGQNSAYGIQGKLYQYKRQILSGSGTVTYKKTIDKHNFSVMIGSEAYSYQQSSSNLANNNLPVDDFGIYNWGIATSPTLALTEWTGNSILSGFSRVTYGYNDKYLLTANFRADGSSKFRPENRWGYFPSLSAAWRIGEEPFLKDIEVLSSMKIRGGWGVSGNNRIADFAAFNLMTVGKWNGYNWGTTETYQPGSVQNNLAVPDLRWETTAQTNFGVDVSFFRHRLEATIDYYHKHTYDLLLNANMALSTGFTRAMQNVGEVENKGLEFSLTSVNIHKKGFKWTTNFNISFNRNKVLKLNDGEPELYSQARFSENNYITRVGQPVGMMFGLEYDRLYQVEDFNWDNESQQYILKDGVPHNGNSEINPGNVKYIDQNGDGTINELDRVIIGNPHPDHFGGLTNNFRYKGFNLQVLFQWSYGFDVMNGNAVEMAKPWNTQSFNGFPAMADAWTPFNTDTDTNSASYLNVLGSTRTGYNVDTRVIEDGSFVRLKTVSLGYDLPKSLLKKIKVKNLNIYVSGQNLFTWTNYSGYDPEVAVSGRGLTPNLDYSAYPQSRTIMTGIKLTL